MDSGADLFASLLWCLSHSSVSRVLVDMSGTTFLDSGGIRAVMEAHYVAAQDGKILQIVGWTANIRRLFEILEIADALLPDSEAPG